MAGSSTFSGKSVLKYLLWTVVAVLFVVVMAVGIMFGPLYKAASSIEKLEDGVYYFEFKGDDGMAKFLENGGAASSGEMAPFITDFLSKGFGPKMDAAPASQDYGCSTLRATTADGAVLMGRNFDWSQALCLIAHVKPKDGYEYISTFDGNLFGFGEDWKPEGIQNQFMALASIFNALDGINEKGLAIADLTAGDREETHQDNGKPDLTTTCALKYMISKAADIDEAIALLGTVDMHSDAGWAHHYSMSDASGRSVVVEYVDNRLVVTESPVVANHYLCSEKYLVGKYPWDMRQETLENIRTQKDGIMDEAGLFEAMKQAWQYGNDNDSFRGTQWTEIFNLSEPSMTLCWNRNEASVFKIEMGL